MKSINDIRIGWRLNLLLGGALVIIISLIGLFIINNSKQLMLAETDQRMKEQVGDLFHMIGIQINGAHEQVDIAHAFAVAYLQSLGSIQESRTETVKYTATNQITKEVNNLAVNKWTLKGKTLQNNFDIVDFLKSKGVESATIFQKIPQGYLRISTNVLNEDSTRAVGTYIPNSSPVAQAIERGEQFHGRAFVVNDWYIASYEPIKINGEIKGMIYVGIREKNMEDIRKVFLEKKYLKRGYPYIVDEEGKLIVHPSSEGTNIASQDFFKRMLASKTEEVHKDAYNWEGEHKIQYYKYYEPIKSYIVATIYEEDIDLGKQQAAILFGLITGLAIFISIIVLISRNITKSLQKGMKFSSELADGNLAVKLNIHQKDEIGQLAFTLNGMVQKLREVISTVSENITNVSTGSEQIALTSQQIAQGANEQAASSEEISSSVEEMLAGINQNTENAQQTESIAMKAEKGIVEAQDATNNTLDTMQNIAKNIDFIKEIASKTDLLAINAAIEAAKAGDHGKGFAVVATEIRKLAENSQKAALTITELTKTSVSVAEKANKVLEEIVPDVQKTARLVQEIAAASIEQETTANQISKAIQQFSTVIQNNSASAEELSSSAEELAAQSLVLKDTISLFRLTDQADDVSKIQRDVLKYVAEAFQAVKDKSIANYDISIKPKDNGEKASGINLNLDERDKEYENF